MDDPTTLHDALLGWFEANRQDLPWRRIRDPYAIWLSETMLQQTRIAAVIPYYERFLARFPTVEALAAASLDEVLKHWEGLGYYSRARSLHRAARIIAGELDGRFPQTLEALLRLPGVGRYTASAVGSLAFGLDVPVVDGNVMRVLARLFAVEDDISQTVTRNRLWALAGDILPPGRAAAWNEALMELGQRVCTPRAPRCAACPLAGLCRAYQQGSQEILPIRARRQPAPHYDVTAAVIRRDDGCLLIAQRPPEGLLGGLWEFPGGKREPGETLEDCLRREIEEELAVAIEVGPPITTIQHAYTHFRITLYAFECRLLHGDPQPVEVADWAWVSPADLDRYPFPVTDQKIIAALQNGGQPALDLGP